MKLQGRRQSKNVVDIRKDQKKAKAQQTKDMMDIVGPYNKKIRAKDIKKVKNDDATKIVNKISANDPTRANRLKNLKSDKPAQKFKK